MTELGETIWRQPVDLDALNVAGADTLIERLGIVFTEFGADWIAATMPVDARTKQPFGLLHGGASGALAESVASMAGILVAGDGSTVVGVELNASHVRKAVDGMVTGIARPEVLGRGMQVWSVRIEDEAKTTVCVSRVTLRVLQPR